MATDTKFNVGDTVTLTGTVQYLYRSSDHVDLDTGTGAYFQVPVSALTLVKKAPLPAPAAGSVVTVKSGFGTSKYIVRTNGTMDLIDEFTGTVLKGWTQWSEFDHSRFTITVV